MTVIKDNLTIYSRGDKHKQHIIFVHGFPFDHSMWENQVKILSPDFFCTTYDIRGLGSSPAGDGQYTLDMFVDDLFGIIEESKLNKPVLCGLSMGGYIALRAIERDEEKFSALILLDTKSAADNDETKLKRAAGIKKINTEGVQKFVSEFIPNCFAEESIQRLGDEYKSILENSMKFSPEGVKGCLLAMAGRTDTTGYLSKIKIPVLLLCGEKDKLTPPDVMKDMSVKIPNSEFHIVPGAGHISPVENPEFMNEKIEGFLKSTF
jgi:pimeloyl-ACP methyl ester carboxylesterase